MNLEIRDATVQDAEAICRIYNPHVRGTIVTFEESDIDAGEMKARIATTTKSLPWLVAERDGMLIAYAYAAKFNERIGYRFAVVSTIYVDDGATRQGVGTALYNALLARLRASPVRTALAIIALPNLASVALHEKCWFVKVGQFDRVGFKFGKWIDVGYWQVGW
jgi:phosphinothricin acetyltransferase